MLAEDLGLKVSGLECLCKGLLQIWHQVEPPESRAQDVFIHAASVASCSAGAQDPSTKEPYLRFRIFVRDSGILRSLITPYLRCMGLPRLEGSAKFWAIFWLTPFGFL